MLNNTLEDIGNSNLESDYVDIYRKVPEIQIKSDNDIALAYNYQCLKLLLLMILARVIVEDKFLKNIIQVHYIFILFI